MHSLKKIYKRMLKIMSHFNALKEDNFMKVKCRTET